jgi:hypothetical protein
MTLRVLAASGCMDGNCPTFFVDDETGEVTVRGYGPDGVTELDVTIPADKWDVLIANLGR